MQRRLLTFLVLGIVMCLSTAAFAVTTIEAGNHVIPDVPGFHVLDIIANGTDDLQGVILNVYTGTGTDPVTDGPGITGITVITPGMVFGANNSGENTFTAGQNANAGTTTSSGFVQAGVNGLLAQVTIDTTGFGPGVYPFVVSGGGQFALNPSEYPQAPFAADVIDGTITIVPEPSSVVLGLFAAAGMAAVVIRRRRAA